jgi:hypothetical protein
METLETVVSALTGLVVAALAIACLAKWRRRRDVPAKWAAMAFGLLAALLVEAGVTPKSGGDTVAWAHKLAMAGLVTVPYCMYRFTTALGHRSRLGDRAAAFSQVTLTLATFLLPRPRASAAEPGRWWLYLVAVYLLGVLAHWTALSAVAAVRLWRSGRRD